MPAAPPPADRQAVQRPNRLAQQTSPYLLQHSHNPVDWYPWGDEAFAEARRRDVPIFLSIGYSTCYWCHVMERESFENPVIAGAMNEGFVCIKVDREERPDVDDVYMAAVQAFSGHGGWPICVFLEPRTLKPFWAGTYFPAEPKFSGVPTFPQVLSGMTSAWHTQRKEILEQAETLAESVKERVVAAGDPVVIDEGEVTRAVTQLLKIHDRVDGGFGPAPKFPQPVYLELLLAARSAAGDKETRDAVDSALRLTLDRMALGGVFDQVGGGFHRYSVDAKWLVPHFEKMLYDNAQLALVYTEAGRVYGDEFYLNIARRICRYVLREMVLAAPGDAGGSGGAALPGGGFCSAQDAEVNHREGQNYLWTPAQLRAVLRSGDAELAIKLYQAAPGGNFRDPHHPDEPASNVLSLAVRPAELAATLAMSEGALQERIDGINTELLAARSKRDQPGTDTKVIAGWNGLMIAALARAGRVLGEPEFTDAARNAADFVLARMRAADGGLLRTFSTGRAQIPAFLEDYAMVIQGLLALHLADADPTGQYLSAAKELTRIADGRFADPATGAFFDTLADQPDLFVRARGVYDGAVPSGAGVMFHDLCDLYQISGDMSFLDRAAKGIAACSAFVAETPLGAANSTRALLRVLSTDRSSLARALAGAKPAPESLELAADQSAVEILSPVTSVEIAPDQPGGLVLRVRIAEGYHLTAALPGMSDAAKGLAPFSVHVVNGTGVSVYADYPKGSAIGDPGREVMIYKGEFELPIMLERSGDWKGRPLIAVTYQACTDAACLKPRTVELDVAIDRK